MPKPKKKTVQAIAQRLRKINSELAEATKAIQQHSMERSEAHKKRLSLQEEQESLIVQLGESVHLPLALAPMTNTSQIAPDEQQR